MKCTLLRLLFFASAVTFSFALLQHQWNYRLRSPFTGGAKKHHSWLSDTVCVTEHERPSGPYITKQSVGRLGCSEKEAEVVRWPDAAGKKRQHCRTRQQGILPFFSSACSSPHQPQPFISRERGLLADTQWMGCVKSGSCDRVCNHTALEGSEAWG